MSKIITTELGRFRAVRCDGRDDWRFECPGCGEWAALDEDQMEGRVSVDHASMGCPGGYHETHEYAKAIVAHFTAARLTGIDPWDVEP